MNTKPILIAVGWPYANGDLHLGHLAGALLPADILARYHRLRGNRVLLVSGSDAHGTPITIAADREEVSPRELFTRYHRRFLATLRDAGISFDLFTHTDTENHHRVARDLFRHIYEAGYITAREQTLLYSESAGRFLPDRYVEGVCPHCGNREARGDQCEACGRLLEVTELLEPRSTIDGDRPVLRRTQHLFLDYGVFAPALLAHYEQHAEHWRPHVLNFSRSYVESGLLPRPVTRDLEWGVGVPVPGWEGKKLYIWFENVVGYLSATIEWAQNQQRPEAWRDWWADPRAESYYCMGEDNVPFHTITWPAQLLAGRGLYGVEAFNLPYDVPANRNLTLGGRDFSTSRGRAVWLPDALARHHPDAIRYAIAATLPETSNSDFTWEEFVRRNNGELVATWGNLVHRVLSFAWKHWGCVPEAGEADAAGRALLAEIEAGFDSVGELITAVRLRPALQEAFRLATQVNGYLSSAPWYQVVRTDKERAATTVHTALQALNGLKVLLAPFLPFSVEQVHRFLGYDAPLFGRQRIETFAEAEREHEALVYDPAGATGRWCFERLAAGQGLRQPGPLYPRLDEDVMATQEAHLIRES